MAGHIESLDKQGLRKFGLVTGCIVAVLFGLLLPWIFDFNYPLWPWYIAGVLWIPALLYPAALNVVYHGWMRFGLAMGWINTRIILGAVFYLIFTPMSLIFWLLRKDPMRRKKVPESESYRIESHSQSVDHMEKPF